MSTGETDERDPFGCARGRLFTAVQDDKWMGVPDRATDAAGYTQPSLAREPQIWVIIPFFRWFPRSPEQLGASDKR